MKISEFKNVLRKQVQLAKAGVPSADRLNIYVQSPPGTGKSESSFQVTQEEKVGFCDVRGSSRDPVDMTGIPYVEHKDGKALARYADPSFLPNAKRDGEFGVIIFDELPQSTIPMQNAMLQIMKDDCCGEYKLPPGWVKVAAGNRETDRAGAGRITTALGNRVVWANLEVDTEEWIAHELAHGGHAQIIAFIRKLPKHLNNFDAKQSVNSTPRSLHFASCIIDQDYPSLMPKDGQGFAIEHELLEGAIGTGVAAEFASFRKIWAKLPDIGEILRGNMVDCPTQPDIQLVTTVALGCALNMNTFEHAIKWMSAKLPPEFATMMVSDARNRLPRLPFAKGFADWTVESGQAIMAV